MLSTPKISVITATYDAALHLPRLIASLQAQSDQDFEWVVVDGGSADNTLALVKAASEKLKNVMIDSRPDFGIYDALNRGVKLATGDYYLVAGADDTFGADAVSLYKKAILRNSTDLISARIESAGLILGPRKRPWPWLYGPFAYVSGHAVGLAIRRSLHDRFGYYSRRFPIAADQLFLLSAIKGGATVSSEEFIAGHFEDANGTSGQDVLGTLLEGFRVQAAVGNSLGLQCWLLAVRLLKNWHRIRKASE